MGEFFIDICEEMVLYIIVCLFVWDVNVVVCFVVVVVAELFVINQNVSIIYTDLILSAYWFIFYIVFCTIIGLMAV